MLTYSSGFLPCSATASIHLFKPPYAIGSIPSISGHAIAYRWRSLTKVHRHRVRKHQGSSSVGLQTSGVTRSCFFFHVAGNSPRTSQNGVLYYVSLKLLAAAAAPPRTNLPQKSSPALNKHLFFSQITHTLTHPDAHGVPFVRS